MTYQSSPLITDEHSKLCAHVLRRRHSVSDSEKLAGVLLQVDLNSHQVEATPVRLRVASGHLPFTFIAPAPRSKYRHQRQRHIG
jgi:hypothetical protein